MTTGGSCSGAEYHVRQYFLFLVHSENIEIRTTDWHFFYYYGLLLLFFNPLLYVFVARPECGPKCDKESSGAFNISLFCWPSVHDGSSCGARRWTRGLSYPRHCNLRSHWIVQISDTGVQYGKATNVTFLFQKWKKNVFLILNSNLKM